MAGITLADGESYNVTYLGDWEYYEVQNRSIRVKWVDDWTDPATFLSLGEGLIFQKKSPLGKFLNNWWWAQLMWIDGSKMEFPHKIVSNVTVVNQWNPSYEWSQFESTEGILIFITPPEEDMNITEAVYDEGVLTVTIGEGYSEEEKFNFQSFVTWYIGIIVGDQTWGLPPFFSWIVRILSVMTILSALIVAKEMLKL